MDYTRPSGLSYSTALESGSGWNPALPQIQVVIEHLGRTGGDRAPRVGGLGLQGQNWLLPRWMLGGLLRARWRLCELVSFQRA